MKTKHVVLTILAAFAITFIISYFKTPEPKKEVEVKHPTIHYLGKDYFQNWREPYDDEFQKIFITLNKNNTRQCANFYVIPIDNSEFVVACTSDEKNFNYYGVWSSIGKSGRLSDDVITVFTPPR